MRANRAVEPELINVRHVLAKNCLSVVRPDRRVEGHFILNAGLQHMKIRAIGINSDEIPDFVRARSEKDLFPVGRPTRVIRIVARDIFEDVQLSGRNFHHSHVTHVTRLARFFDSVERDTRAVG